MRAGKEQAAEAAEAWEALEAQWGPVRVYLDSRIKTAYTHLGVASRTLTMDAVRKLQATIEVCTSLQNLPQRRVEEIKEGE